MTAGRTARGARIAAEPVVVWVQRVASAQHVHLHCVTGLKLTDTQCGAAVAQPSASRREVFSIHRGPPVCAAFARRHDTVWCVGTGTCRQTLSQRAPHACMLPGSRCQERRVPRTRGMRGRGRAGAHTCTPGCTRGNNSDACSTQHSCGTVPKRDTTLGYDAL